MTLLPGETVVLTLVLCVIYMRVSNFVIKSNKKTFWVKKCKDEFGATLIVKKLLKKTTTMNHTLFN